ncbi:MAG: transglutaminase family protein [Acidobacteria bacterium]|nr:transglutaminase family protein [Acidobacteriota bacterium]
MSLYRIEHETRYAYHSPVATSQHIAWLEPRRVAWQTTHAASLVIDPAPLRVMRRTDYFGNVVHQFELLRPHLDMRVVSRGVVEVVRDGATADTDGPAWENVYARLRRPASEAERSAAEFTFESPQVSVDAGLAAFGRSCVPAGRPLLEGALALMHRIHDEFTFDPAATTPTTPVSKVLADRRGVCQDFAHLQIACLRALGLAARYVSGYLLTDPPPGLPRLVGADASHAWVSVFCPLNGWVDLDPTNDVRVSDRHVTVAWGRDYSDVTPLRGVLLGGDEHQLYVGVSVIPVDTPVDGV